LLRYFGACIYIFGINGSIKEKFVFKEVIEKFDFSSDFLGKYQKSDNKPTTEGTSSEL